MGPHPHPPCYNNIKQILEKRRVSVSQSASSAVVPLSSFLKVLQGFPLCPYFHCCQSQITRLLHFDAWGVVLFHIECLEELVGTSQAFHIHISHCHGRIELQR